MVGGATNQQPPASQFATTEEDQFLKRNTDCVYFLASPLTCKKGSECEYRHSDIARVNPRDCYYWLNGNCLNPKCGFRHPPLDGLFGAEDPTIVGPAVSQPPVKQGIACIFFQTGFCFKGHLCPFLHGPPNMSVQPTPPNPATKPSKPASAGPEKCIQEQKFKQYEPVQKPIGPQPPHGKQEPKVQLRNGGVGGGATEKKVESPPEEPSRYKPASVVPPPVMNEIPLSRFNHGVYETNHVLDNEGINGKDVEEYSREPTPGFDVLVDNELDDSEYYPNEEKFGRSTSHDFDTVPPVDYDVDLIMYPEKHDFERKEYYRDESPNQFAQLDLRHRVSKQNGYNVGGLRSVIRHEHHHDNRSDRITWRDRHNDRQLDSGHLSSRLRGRIKIPRRSMPAGYVNGSRVEREIHIRRQHRSRYSPARLPYISSNRNRFRDGLKGKSNNDFNNEQIDYRDYRGRRQSDDGQTLGKRKYPRTESQQSEVNVSFEGPKPLSEILKRKRGSITSSIINEDNHVNKNNKDNLKERTEISSWNTVNADNEKSTNGQSSLDHETSDVKNKVGSIDEDAMLDEELEAYDQRDGDYEYEQIDGEDYNLEEEDDMAGKKEGEVCY